MRKLFFFLLMLSLFLLFFLQFPLNCSLTGDIDGIGNLAMHQQIKTAIDGWLFSQPTGSICYPVSNPWTYFGLDFGFGIVHVGFNYLGFNDLWAHWMFISLLFALNSFALFLLLTALFKKAEIPLLIASLLFSFSHFTLANLENPNTLVFFFSFLSLYFYLRHLRDPIKNNLWFALSVILGAVQIYFSPYNFIYHIAIWAMFVLIFEFRSVNRKMLVKYLLTAFFFILVIFPYIKIYLLHQGFGIAPDQLAKIELSSKVGLAIGDYFRTLPNHLYMDDSNLDMFSWQDRIKSAYLGVGFYVISLIGLIKGRENRVPGIALLLIGIILATGPFIVVPGLLKIPNITYPLYKYLGLGDIFRFSSRGFFISLLGLVFLATAGMIYLKERKKYLLMGVLVTLAFAENIPWPMYTYQHEEVLYPDQEMIDYLKDNSNIVLSLPSSIMDYHGNRNEYIYMYWQHFHKKNILNASLGFYPESRLKVNDLLVGTTRSGIQTLIREYEVGTIVFQKDLASAEESAILDSLNANPNLNRMLDTDRSAIFETLIEQ